MDFMIPGGSGVLGSMTGSVGTAMDVLVTCFSKKGGGSGRRGCKYSATAGVWKLSRIPFRVFSGSLKVWQALHFGDIYGGE